MNAQSESTFKKIGGKDYCAYWFDAMRAIGLDDRSYAVRFDPRQPEKVLEVRRYSHATGDSFGNYRCLGRDTGDVFEFLDPSYSPRPPLSLWQTMRLPAYVSPLDAIKKQPPPWLPAVPASCLNADSYGGQIAFEPELMDRIRAHCATIPCSVYSWVSWAVHQTVQRTLLAQPAPLIWTYMVSMRPWVALDEIEGNHISGLGLALPPEISARGVADEIKAGFVRNDHWRNWYGSQIGRFIGRWGVLQIYKRVRNMHHTAGHISHTGRVGNRSGAMWALAGIPSPGAPLNFNTQELNGHLAIGLRVDTTFGFSERAPNAQAVVVALKQFVVHALDQADAAKRLAA